MARPKEDGPQRRALEVQRVRRRVESSQVAVVRATRGIAGESHTVHLSWRLGGLIHGPTE